MNIPTPRAASGRPVAPSVSAETDEVTCPECGHVVHVRTDRRVQRHNEPAPAGKDR